MSKKHLLILGATGKTGMALVNQAISKGYDVTVAVRDVKKLDPIDAQKITVIEADIQKKETLIPVFQDKHYDATISSLGIFIREAVTPLADGTKNVLEVMEQFGHKRLICVTSLGCGDSKGEGGWMVGMVQSLVLKYVLKDKDWQERHIIKSGLDWTLIRPPQLTNYPDIHEKVTRWVGPLAEGEKVIWKVSRKDVAAECIKVFEDNSFIREAITIAIPK